MSALSRRSMIAGAALSVPLASTMVYVDAHADEVQGGITPQNRTKNYINLLSYPQVKADGSQDCTQAINDAVRTLASAGGGALEIPAGKYRVSAPFIQLLDRVEIFGHGKATQIIAHPGGGLVQKDADEAECVGVFHIGSYLVAGPEKPKPGDKGANQWFSEAPMRFGVRDLVIRTNADNVPLNRDDPYSRARHTPVMKGVAGVILHTYYANRNYRPEPEAVATLENLEIWDADMGVAILGLHDRAMKVHNIRVRMTWRQGFLVGKPIGHKAINVEGVGAADNKFSMLDVSDANNCGRNYAGIEVYASQCKFSQSTSWYNHRYSSGESLYWPREDGKPHYAYAGKAGAGWYVAASRNMFIGCTAQENGGHGWVSDFERNIFDSCIGESSSYFDTAHGKAQNNQAANWYISNWSHECKFIAPRSDNPHKVGDGAIGEERNVRAARWGFYFESNCRDIVVVGGDVYDEYRKAHPENYSWKVHFGPWRAGYMDITINEFIMRYGMHDIEEEVKTNPKKYTDIQKYEMNKYLGANVEF